VRERYFGTTAARKRLNGPVFDEKVGLGGECDSAQPGRQQQSCDEDPPATHAGN
jgi:hypothetical protein